MPTDIADIVRDLADRAEDVCRHYLPAGRREGLCWRIGDVRNAPGRSVCVRLGSGTPGGGAAGKWVDFASGEHGDLLDMIREARGFPNVADALDEARRFLGQSPPGAHARDRAASSAYDFRRTLRRLLSESSGIAGTIAEAYLRSRGLDALDHAEALRFHPACPCRDGKTGRFSHFPALLAVITDSNGDITGLQRTYLARDGAGKATVASPRRSIGTVFTHAVRFGQAHDVGVAGEGVETILSLKTAMPEMPMLAALSATNLAALAWPASLQRLYISLDRDQAGTQAAAALSARASRSGVKAIPLTPVLQDFNDDLMSLGRNALLANLSAQLLADDLNRASTE